MPSHDFAPQMHAYADAWLAAPLFSPGSRVRLVDELGGAAATIKDAYRVTGLFQIELSGGKNVVVSAHALQPVTPTWQPGDVAVIHYGPHRTPYTYVRGREAWLVEKDRPQKSDSFMNAQLAAGRLKPVLQAGGEPFDPARLA